MEHNCRKNNSYLWSKFCFSFSM